MNKETIQIIITSEKTADHFAEIAISYIKNCMVCDNGKKELQQYNAGLWQAADIIKDIAQQFKNVCVKNKKSYNKEKKGMEQTKNTVTKEQINKIIGEASIKTLKMGEKTTVVIFTTKEGFEIIETSSCVDKANYSEEIGKSMCMERLINKLWLLEGYVLQKKLYKDNLPRACAEETPKDRVIKELADLKEKYAKLEKFILSPDCDKKLSKISANLLRAQAFAMEQYIRVLEERLNNWED